MTTTKPNLPYPAGALEVHDWEPGGTRKFFGTSRVVDIEFADFGPLSVMIAGVQRSSDGSMVRRLVLNDEYSRAIDTRQARQLARQLIAAADEIDWLSAADARIKQ
jgi:hypothetical protein